MSELGFYVDDKHKANLAQAEIDLANDVEKGKDQKTSASLRPFLLRQAINSYLTYINCIPGATIDAADATGKGEGAIRKDLMDHEKEKEKLSWSDLQKKLLGLIDLKGVEKPEQRLALLANHMDLVKDSYPKAWKDSRLNKKNTDDLLEKRQDLYEK
ncbi:MULTISPECIES: hypothetical protein [unclassified Streptomyces]|uniref:hypothetical protein n=1 Tax=unclassified Streptomyces TaxID=2593676 RepID=UPI0036EE6AAD